ncbi:MAG: hypothetical protein O7C98_09285 [Planctomycetota bacterium]|nr:hypothetical protein [Planctomycetota bacterium]
MPRTAVLLAALIGAAGGYLGLSALLRSPPEFDAYQPSDLWRDSYYLSRLRGRVLAVSDMTPVLVSGRTSETIPPTCPERLVVVTSVKQYADAVLPFMDAVGTPDFGALPADGLAGKVVARIQKFWGVLRERAQAPPRDAPVRIIVRHYPRPELPGRCYTVHVIFYDVLDPVFDAREYQLVRRVESGKPLEGGLIEWRKTYQTQGAAPRLIEAAVEAQPCVLPGMERPSGIDIFGKKLGGRLKDPSVKHFWDLGGGDRYGLAWYDLSNGVGDPEPWARVYHVEWHDPEGNMLVTDEEAPAGPIERLKEIIKRL